MPDWVGGDGSATADRYRSMAERELRGISPTYEALCLGVAGDPELLARLDELPAPRRQPNLLLGAVRFLDGPVTSFAQFRAFVLDRWPDVAEILRTRRTQTNEPGRCATLLPTLVELRQPLALLEVGRRGRAVPVPRPVRLRVHPRRRLGAGRRRARRCCRATSPGPVRCPPACPTSCGGPGSTSTRSTCATTSAVRWLEALIWPEQNDRFTRLRAAVDVARADPPAITGGTS